MAVLYAFIDNGTLTRVIETRLQETGIPISFYSRYLYKRLGYGVHKTVNDFFLGLEVGGWIAGMNDKKAESDRLSHVLYSLGVPANHPVYGQARLEYPDFEFPPKKGVSAEQMAVYYDAYSKHLEQIADNSKIAQKPDLIMLANQVDSTNIANAYSRMAKTVLDQEFFDEMIAVK